MERKSPSETTDIYELKWGKSCPIMDFYKLEPEDFIIIHDDIDFDVGRLRI